ncbi:MAG TPA: class I SAM-dependent methyltransferase [Rhizobiales bacterium]|nr:class I SAM-dependent methyltransferase [Hyphomicrobiales bacterium]
MSAADGREGGHAALMDGVYRWQRHIYDATRKYYLLGRDRLIAGLDVPRGGSVLELGCGTGRNLLLTARRYPDARLHGLDISAAMLETADATLSRRGLRGRVALARADATRFDAEALFGDAAFDRIFVSYAMSMIPGWEQAVDAALGALAPSGSLHVVDFGQQERLPGWFASALRAWLARFHVSPRAGLVAEIATRAEADGRPTIFTPLHRGYAWLVVVGPRADLRSAPASRPG